jgi:spectinomycin phosphotransferase
VRARPADLDDEAVLGAVADGWGLQVTSSAYLPEGGGSHHWKVTDAAGSDLFVTVDDLDERDWLGHTREQVLNGARRALTTVAALRDEAGLRFVVAPLAGTESTLVRRVDARYAVSVYPFLVGNSYPFGPYMDPNLRVGALDMLAALHRATPVVSDIAPAHEPVVGYRQDLDAFLREPDSPWDAGPFSEPAREILTTHATELAAVANGFDRLVGQCASQQAGPVVTHGEPHPANVMSVSGSLFLIDWDTVGLARPERDLCLVIEDGTEDARRYEAATGHAVDPAAMTIYRLRWYLDDIASAVHLFRHPHERTADTQGWWEGLAPRLGLLESWRKVLA